MQNSLFKFSVLLVGLNELDHLKNILPELCENVEDVNYFDLGSTDGSIEFVKNQSNCNLHIVPRENNVETIHYKYSKLCKYDWIIYIDPDERWPLKLLGEINTLILSQTSAVYGAISSGIQFYFGRKPLKGTRWGGIKTRGIAFNKKRVNLSTDVHRSKRLLQGYKNHYISNFVIIHYWMSSWKELIDKHRRYLNNEGRSRLNANYEINIKRLLLTPTQAFYFCFIVKRGYKDGLTGLLLSLFWAWYDTKANYKLLICTRQNSL